MSENELIAVEMEREEWDVVVHALEEEMAQLEPMGPQIGDTPETEAAGAIGEAHEQIMQAIVQEHQ